MTSLERFKTLLPIMTSIYSNDSSASRTEMLRDGILQIADLLKPASAEAWALVRQDADRVLRLWGVKESDNAAGEMAAQLIGMIDNFTIDSIMGSSGPESGSGPEDVSLVIEEKELPAPPPAVPVAMPAVVFDETEPEPSNIKVVVIHETPATGLDAEDVEDEDDKTPDVAEDEDDEPSGCLAAATLEDEDEEEDEGDNEDDNEGITVQKIFHKGRGYWHGSDNKIYACADDDEIGEEIGDYDPVEKKPLFY